MICVKLSENVHAKGYKRARYTMYLTVALNVNSPLVVSEYTCWSELSVLTYTKT